MTAQLLIAELHHAFGTGSEYRRRQMVSGSLADASVSPVTMPWLCAPPCCFPVLVS